MRVPTHFQVFLGHGDRRYCRWHLHHSVLHVASDRMSRSCACVAAALHTSLTRFCKAPLRKPYNSLPNNRCVECAFMVNMRRFAPQCAANSPASHTCSVRHGNLGFLHLSKLSTSASARHTLYQCLKSSLALSSRPFLNIQPSNFLHTYCVCSYALQ